ncbi:hemerythrin domain-containing protein [Microbacter margulisiae]|uniref:Regulator of cell morphogenesis and NO signaling n=1 Tax=Microbacter margulisiae TaxID=1350067 RepID=A0A7W5DPS7_9PORP|nr:hemerythrin domain-containing protein [Microbacter margulisiae]MBB3186058.1 regulator of cell morphogenesis and NO signaling [Microbacter margulisiae]
MKPLCKADDTFWELIVAEPEILLVMNRFGLSLGVGDKTIHEVCQEKHIDENTFLAISNLTIHDDEDYTISPEHISLKTLTDYLINAHDYFFNFRYPAIRQKLIAAIDRSDEQFYALMLRYFDEYVHELQMHTDFEEKTIFSHIIPAQDVADASHMPIGNLHRWHEQINLKMNEIKNIIIKYFPPNEDASALNLAVYDLFACEEEFNIHCRIEDLLLTPAILANESKAKKKR